MIDESTYPFIHHPCWSQIERWERIHLPVARKCNVKCIYCDHKLESSCHTSPKPGTSRKVMKPQEAVERCFTELKKRENLRIIAISGPGDPLANEETFECITKIRNSHPELKFCLSTNGTLLETSLEKLLELQVQTISVTMSSAKISTVEKIYQWISEGKKRISGIEMASKILESQIEGIMKASRAGIFIKVNTVLIPGLNEHDMIDLAKTIRKAGAKLQNIIPLIPLDAAKQYTRPSKETLERIREQSEKIIPQFKHCKQCRSDVVGIPGHDTIL